MHRSKSGLTGICPLATIAGSALLLILIALLMLICTLAQARRAQRLLADDEEESGDEGAVVRSVAERRPLVPGQSAASHDLRSILNWSTGHCTAERRDADTSLDSVTDTDTDDHNRRP